MENGEYDTRDIENLDPDYEHYEAPLGMYNPNENSTNRDLQLFMKEISQQLYVLTRALNHKRLDERKWCE